MCVLISPLPPIHFFVSLFYSLCADYANGHLDVCDRNERGGSSGRQLFHDIAVGYFMFALVERHTETLTHTQPHYISCMREGVYSTVLVLG